MKIWTEIQEEQDLKKAYLTDIMVHRKKYYVEVETFISIIE